ncbi:MAG: GcrA family cell cycle regulator [Aliihoeflea sp.]|uniref:GcrA family cell cycle regulator n=1 Tax=Aliihoeflea sp. TaxID=2608088 RepID=UPI004033674B
MTARENSWTEEQIVFAAKLWNDDGLSGADIANRVAAQFGVVRTRSAVMGMIGRESLRFARRKDRQGRAVAKPKAAPRVKSDTPAPVKRPAKVVLLAHEVAFAAQLWSRNQSYQRIADVLSDRFGKPVCHDVVRKLVAERPKIFKERGRGALMRGNRNPHHAANMARAGVASNDYEAPATSDEARAYDAASRRLPLADLEWRDCRFPVNDAARGETHLFCGAATFGNTRWCRHHLMRVKGTGTEGERKATRDLIFEAKRAA